MNFFKKIIFYNSPQNIIVRFKAFNKKQKWLFIDAIAMLIFALYFLTTELMFMLYLCVAFSIMSIVGIYFTKGE